MIKKNKPRGEPKPASHPADRSCLPETPASEDDIPFIVAVAASAGGLKTLKPLFMHSSPHTNIAYVVITPLSREHLSILPELLQQYTTMTVLPIMNNQTVQAGCIYVLPPGKNVSIQAGRLQLIEQAVHTPPKMPIDFFLCSLAKDQGHKGICIILSGMGHDGSLGLRTLREHGALVLAQTAKSALYEGMPKSAIDTGLVDYILLPEDMFAFIIKYIAHLHDKTIKLEASISDEINQILKLVKTHTGHDFSQYKPNTVFRRIQKRLSLLQLQNLSAYLTYLQYNPSETVLLLKKLLINVTNFFRNPCAFEALKHVLLDTLLKDRPAGEGIRIWIPGCATGEEAYSIAIILQECMSVLKKDLNVQIFGTDIDKEAIEIARAGIFPASIDLEISAERLSHYFIKKDDSYQVKGKIRKMILFAEQNVITDPPFTRLDLLSCRNLLIYFNAFLQKKILSLFHYTLNPGGILFLGTSETIGSARNLFSMPDKKWKIFKRHDSESSLKTVMDLRMNQPSELRDIKMIEKNPHEGEHNLSNLVKHILLKNHTPACVIIDEKGIIIYAYGKTSKFLEFATGEVKLHFMDMVRTELKSQLFAAVQQAIAQQKENTFKELRITGEEGFIEVKVRPIIEANVFKRKLVLIIFEEKTTPAQTVLKKKKRDPEKNIPLELELQYTKESLQTTIEELETSNQELKSSNEAVQFTNEELQSINEELETSKEELQSLNEKLTTMNVELENRIEQLSSTHDDIRNLLDNTEIATIFLDKDLCIKHFTPKATEIINLIATDIGRPISHIVSNLQYEKLLEDARSVLNTLEPKTTEGIDKSGRWYLIRIIPYRTITHIIDGVVVTFLNIHAQKQAENKLTTLSMDLTQAKNLNQVLLNAIPSPALIINEKNEIVAMNARFTQQSGSASNTLIGQSIYQCALQWDMHTLPELLEPLAQNPVIEHYKLNVGNNHCMEVNAHKIPGANILLMFNPLIKNNASH